MFRYIINLFKPAPYPSAEGFKKFAKTQSGGYNFSNIENCALTQYVKSLGHSGRLTDVYSYRLRDGTVYDFRELFPELVEKIMTNLTWEELVKELH